MGNAANIDSFMLHIRGLMLEINLCYS